MIFRMISIYRKTKKGLNDPVGFAGEEIQDAYTGTVIIPGIILLAVIIILGILSFTHLIATPSLAAQIFFWIFLVVGIIYTVIAVVIGNLIARIIKIGEDRIRSTMSSDQKLE